MNTTKKYTAKECPPEWTDSHFEYEDYDLVSFFGNDRMDTHTTELCETCKRFLDEYACWAHEIRAHRYYESVIRCGTYAPSHVSASSLIERELLIEKVSRGIIRKILSVMDGYARDDKHVGKRDANCYLADLMTIVGADGVKYVAREIHGCCQGDWQHVIAPKDMDFNDLSTRYWNTGTEYAVEDENGEPIANVYCTEWREADQLKHIADEIGCKPEDVRVMKFDGWAKTPKYKAA